MQAQFYCSIRYKKYIPYFFLNFLNIRLFNKPMSDLMSRINSQQIQHRYTNRTRKPRHVPCVSTSRRRADWFLKGIFFKDESRSTNARGQTKLQIICNCGGAQREREGMREYKRMEIESKRERMKEKRKKKIKQRKNASETVVFRRKRNYKEANPRDADGRRKRSPLSQSRSRSTRPFFFLSLFLRFLRLLQHHNFAYQAARDSQLCISLRDITHKL